jgi:hypothetical protein
MERKMTARATLPLLVLFALASVPLVGREHKPHGKEVGKHAGFESFKRLAGEWVGKGMGKDGHDVRVRYHVTAGGSAVVETIMPGTEHEMVSVIHPDGADLLLTHYCHLGNQPHMKASGNGDGKKVEFQFVRATNLKSANDKHMHGARYTFVDADTLRSEWTLYNEGKAAAHVVFELKRKK